MIQRLCFTLCLGVATGWLLQVGVGNAAQPCRIAKGDSPVAKACAEGGVVRAKQSMRALVKQARDRGTSFMCEDCHQDVERYELLQPEAKAKFAKLLAATR
jgi:hypothetical protein